MSLAEYVTKTAQLAVTHRCGRDCQHDSNQQICEGTLYAYGPAPHGCWGKLTALAARYGYTLVRNSPLPHQLNGAGTSGFTVGYIPEEHLRQYPVRPFTIYLQQGLAPATEFLVACHELTHMLLRHPPQNMRDVYAVNMKRQGEQESFGEEVQAHLAAIAVAKQAGVKIRRSALCYLAGRVRNWRQAPSLHDQRDALKAAQVITSALNTTSYARAA